MEQIQNKETVLDIVFKKPLEVLNLPPASEVAEAYKRNSPFPHLIIDGFFNSAIAKEIAVETKNREAKFSVTFDDDYQKNKTISTGDDVPRTLSLLAAKLASPEVLNYLESVTGLKGLIPDPYYNTEYGYYHIVGAGGVLGSHVDHSHHQRLGIPHVLNLVIYLTEDWDDKDGGALCLFDETGKRVVSRVPCAFNRAAIFAANPITYHGVEGVKDTAKRKRHSIYFAYYSVNGKDEAGMETFPSLHAKDNLSNTNIRYATYFVMPWYKLLSRRNLPHLRIRVGSFARLILPPFMIMGLKRLLKTARGSAPGEQPAG